MRHLSVSMTLLHSDEKPCVWNQKYDISKFQWCQLSTICILMKPHLWKPKCDIQCFNGSVGRLDCHYLITKSLTPRLRQKKNGHRENGVTSCVWNSISDKKIKYPNHGSTKSKKCMDEKKYIKRNCLSLFWFKICSRGEKWHEMKTNSVPSFLHGHFRYWLDLARACRTRLCTHHPRRAIVHTWTKQCSSTCHSEPLLRKWSIHWYTCKFFAPRTTIRANKHTHTMQQAHA